MNIFSSIRNYVSPAETKESEASKLATDSKITPLFLKAHEDSALRKAFNASVNVIRGSTAYLFGPSQKKERDQRMLFQIHADKFGQGSKLEGYSQKKTIGYLVELLEQYNLSDHHPKLMRQLNVALKLATTKNFVDDALKETIDSFKKGESVLTPGGWVGKPAGHAINYELILEADNTCTMRFYNLGSGVNLFAGITVGQKDSGPAYSEWTGISRERIESREFFTIIGEIAGLVPGSENQEYDESDLFGRLKTRLMPTAQRAGARAPLMQLQESGVCTWRSLMALLRSHLSENQYKGFIQDVKLHSLKEHWELSKESRDPTELNLLLKSTKKMSLSVAKALKNGLMTAEQAEQRLNLLSAIKADLEERQKVSPDKNLRPSSLSYHYIPQQLSMGPLALAVTSDEASSTSSTPWADRCHKISIEKLTNKNFPSVFSHIKDAEEAGDFTGIHVGIADLVTRADIDTFSDITTKDEAQSAIVHLGELSKQYVRSCYGIEDADLVKMEELFILEKIANWQEKLSEKAGFQCQWERAWGESLHECFYDSKMRKEKSNIPTQDESVFPKIGTYSYSTELLETGLSDNDINKMPFDNLDEYLKNTYRELWDANQALKGSQNHRLVRSLYGENVPKWIKAMRECQLNIDTIIHLPILRMPPPSLATTFTVVEEEVKISIEVKREGLLKTHFSLTENQSSDHQKEGRRFSAAHRKPNSKEIQEFIKRHTLKRTVNETNIITLCEIICIEGLSKEEYAELMHIFTFPELMQTHALEYFRKYPDKLADPDYQTLLCMALFRDEIPEEIVPKLDAFITNQKTHAKQKREVQLYSFLSELQRHLGNQGTDEGLINFANDESLPETDRALAWCALGARIASKSEISDEDALNLLKARSYIEVNPLPKSCFDPIVLRDLKLGMGRHAHTINNLLNTNTDVTAELFTLCHPGEESKAWKRSTVESGFSTCETLDQKTLYFPLQGRFIFPGRTQKLPEEFTKNPDFKRLFSSSQQAAPNKDATVWSFKDQLNHETLVKFREGKLIIQQKLEMGWVEYISPQSLEFCENETIIESRFLQKAAIAFRLVDSPEKWILCDKATRNVTHEIQVKDNYIQPIKRADSLVLKKPRSPLSFESEGLAHYWYDGDTLKEVEFPRYGLHFKGENLNCEEIPGWHLSPNEVIPDLWGFKDALILKNSEGKLRVLIPNQDFHSVKKNEMESLAPYYALNKCAGPIPELTQEYYLYEVNSKKHLQSPKRVENLQLAGVLLAAQSYRQAAKLLMRHGNKLSKFTPSESRKYFMLLEMKKCTGDTSADASLLQTFAGISLLRQTKSKKEEILNSTLESYQNLLKKRRLATCMTLSKEDETFLLKTALDASYDPLLHNRLAELDPKAASSIEVKQAVEPMKEKNADEELDYSMLSENSSSPETALMTRPGVLFTHFIYYKDKIVSGDKTTIRFVQHALPYLKAMKGGDGAAKLYAAILKEPELFRSFTLSGRKKSEEIEKMKELVKTIDVDLSDLEFELKTVASKRVPTRGNASSTTEVYKPEYLSIEGPEWRSLIKDSIAKNVSKAGYEIQKVVKWAGEQQKIPGQDRLVRESYTDLVDDLAAFDAQQANGEFRCQVFDEDAFLASLEKDRSANQENLYGLKKSIVIRANKLPEDKKERAVTQSKGVHSGRKGLTFKALLMNYATGRTANLRDAKPSLTDEDIQLLYNQIGEYLLHATFEQQRERALEKIQEGSFEQAAAELHTKRAYDPTKNPEYLVFEYFGDLLMREEQVDKLRDFIDEGDMNPLMEMIMGSGKSKILLPLIALMRADGDHLATLVVPEALFESVAHDTQALIGSAFAQQLKALHFDRNTTFTPLSLELIRDDLEAIKKERKALIMTSKSLQCLLLKYVEIMNESGREKEKELMTEIIALIHKDIAPTLDEVDTLLDVLHEVSFSIGETSTPPPWHSSLTGQLLHWITEDKTLKGLARVEIDEFPNDNAPPLTKRLYEEKVLPKLADLFIKKMRSFEIEDKKLSTKWLSFTQAADKKLLLDYLTRNPKNSAAAQSFFGRQDPEVQDIIALAAEEICSILPHTLTRNLNEDYGVDEESSSHLAIPFGGPSAPKKGSQFLSSDVTNTYTLQYYLKAGISKELLLKEIHKLQGKALREIEENDAQNLEDTDAYKEFTTLTKGAVIPLFKFTDAHIEQLLEKINDSHVQKLLFTRKFILPELQTTAHKISCNPLNLMEFLPGGWGFTGTLWNGKSMHRSLSPKPAPGTDAKTISILWNNSLDKVQRVDSTSLEVLVDALGNQDFEMIADAGAYFKEKSNEEVAKILSNKKGKPCVYYNAKKELSIWVDGKSQRLREVNIPPSERITFLDQSHCTGSDVPQKSDAKAFVTIGTNMLTRDLLQSVWRMRGLAKDQRIEFVLTKDVEELIRDTLSLKDDAHVHFPEILRFTMLNQVKRQGKDNYKALEQELTAFTQSILFNVLLSDKLSKEEKDKATKELQSLWIKPAILPPRVMYGKISKLVDAKEVTSKRGATAKSEINVLLQKLPFLKKLGYTKEYAEQTIDEIIDSKSAGLADKIMVPKQMDEDQSVEVETEAEQEQEIQVEAEEHQEKRSDTPGSLNVCEDKIFSRFKSCDSFAAAVGNMNPSNPRFKLKKAFRKYNSAPIALSLDAYLSSKSETRGISSAFAGLYVSANFFDWATTEKPSFEKMKLFGTHRKPIHEFVIENNHMVIIPGEESSEDKKVVNITLRDQELTQTQKENCIKLKFLDGQSHFSKEEQKFLSQWIKRNGADKMIAFYEKVVLSGKPDKRTRYQSSALKRVFQTAVAV